jgi:mannose-6-phosphate isomerase-like protein (cupin superfamily)
VSVRQPNGPAQFPRPKDVGPREWGREELLHTMPGKFTLKRIEMKAGAVGGLQYHHRKDECGVMIEGQMIVTHDNGNGLVDRVCWPGDVFYFPQGAVHRATAVTDVVYIEASTPFLNDRQHVEHLYGLPEAGGLPSTQPEDVVAL